MKNVYLRDPSVIVAILASVVQVLVVFNLGLTDETAALVIATVTAGAGVVTALSLSKDKLLAAIVGLAQSLFALLLGFGVALDAEQVSALMAVVTVVAGAFLRTQVQAKVRPVEVPLNTDAR